MTKAEKIIDFMNFRDYAEEHPEDIEYIAAVTPDGLEELAALLLDTCDEVYDVEGILTGYEYTIWPREDLSYMFKWMYHRGWSPAQMWQTREEEYPDDYPEGFLPCGKFAGEIGAGIVQVVTNDDLNEYRRLKSRR